MNYRREMKESHIMQTWLVTWYAPNGRLTDDEDACQKLDWLDKGIWGAYYALGAWHRVRLSIAKMHSLD